MESEQESVSSITLETQESLAHHKVLLLEKQVTVLDQIHPAQSTLIANAICSFNMLHIAKAMQSDVYVARLIVHLNIGGRISRFVSRVYCGRFQLHRPIWPFESDSKLRCSFCKYFLNEEEVML